MTEVTRAMIEAGFDAIESGSVSTAEIEQIYLEMEARRIPAPAPDDGVERELFLKRQWHQEAERAERLDNEVRALHRQLDHALSAIPIQGEKS